MQENKEKVTQLIQSKVSLAPMAGITDYVLRSLVRKYSKNCLLTTEMISSEFLAQATPAVSLISCSATNRYGHPGQETLERLQTEKSAVRITKNCGAICLWTDGSVIKLKTVK